MRCFIAGKRSKKKRKSLEQRGRTRAILSLSSLYQDLSHLLSFYFQLLKSLSNFCRIPHSYSLHCLTLKLQFLHSSESKCAFPPYMLPDFLHLLYIFISLLPPNSPDINSSSLPLLSPSISWYFKFQTLKSSGSCAVSQDSEQCLNLSLTEEGVFWTCPIGRQRQGRGVLDRYYK